MPFSSTCCRCAAAAGMFVSHLVRFHPTAERAGCRQVKDLTKVINVFPFVFPVSAFIPMASQHGKLQNFIKQNPLTFALIYSWYAHL